MFDPILVPLDGSQLAECVLPHVAAVARSFDSEITLLRMLEKNQPCPGAPAQVFDLVNWQINKTKSALYLEKTKARFHEAGLRAQTMVLEGLAANGITEYAQNQGMKLIVLSSHGRNGLTQWGVSSVTQKIILSAQISLLIVRARQPNSGDLLETPIYQRILAPLDGSQRAENVLPVVTQLAQFHKSQIHLAQIVQTPEMARQMPPTPEDMDLSNRVVARNQGEAGRYLEQVKFRSALEGITVQTHLITGANAFAELHRVAEQEHIDMVALSAHGYSGNHQWPYGSMVNNFIAYGKAPLLIVQDQPAKQESTPLELSSRERAER